MSENAKTMGRQQGLLTGFVASYTPATKVYLIRPLARNLPPFECPAIDNGFDNPFGVGDQVAVQYFPNYGFVVTGRLPTALSQRPINTRQPNDTQPKDSAVTTYRPLLSKDSLFNAQDGDLDIERGSSRLFLSRVGVAITRVAETCFRYCSKTLNTIKDVCHRYILSLPGITLVLKVDEEPTSATVGQPSVALEVVPTNKTNKVTLKAGGGILSGVDGMDLLFGNLIRLMLQLIPANPKITYTHGEAQFSLDLQTFLATFALATFKWSAEGLSLVRGNTQISVSAADLLAIVTSTANIQVSGTLNVQAQAMNVNAPARFSTPVNIQTFDYLTVVTTLNLLILTYNTHIHQAGPIPTSPPANAGVVIPVLPS